LLNLENFESDFCGLSEPETGHVVVSHDDKDSGRLNITLNAG